MSNDTSVPTPTALGGALPPAPAPAAPAAAAAAAAAPAPAPAAPASGDNLPPDWRASLPESIRGHKNLSSLKSVEDLATQYVNAQELIGKKTIPVYQPPPDTASKEELDKFYAAVGRPDTPDGYDLDPATIEGLTVEESAMKDFKTAFHGAGLSKKQFSIAVQKYAEYVKGKAAVEAQAEKTAITSGLTALREELGPNYGKELQCANDAFESLAPDGLKALFSENPRLANHPDVIRLFAKLGKAISEDSIRGITKTGTGFSPSSPTEALDQLHQFERENGDVLYGLKKVPYAQAEQVRTRRMELYRKAYPGSPQG